MKAWRLASRLKAWRLTAAALTILLVAACTESGAAPASGGDQSLFDREPAARLSVALEEFEFDPPTIEVPAGALTELTLVNNGSIEHDFSIRSIPGDEAYRIDGDPPATDRSDGQDIHVPLLPGATATLRVLPTEPGEYELYCSVSGHRRAGMRTTFTVK